MGSTSWSPPGPYLGQVTATPAFCFRVAFHNKIRAPLNPAVRCVCVPGLLEVPQAGGHGNREAVASGSRAVCRRCLEECVLQAFLLLAPHLCLRGWRRGTVWPLHHMPSLSLSLIRTLVTGLGAHRTLSSVTSSQPTTSTKTLFHINKVTVEVLGPRPVIGFGDTTHSGYQAS